jgi:hypothetical protein
VIEVEEAYSAVERGLMISCVPRYHYTLITSGEVDLWASYRPDFMGKLIYLIKHSNVKITMTWQKMLVRKNGHTGIQSTQSDLLLLQGQDDIQFTQPDHAAQLAPSLSPSVPSSDRFLDDRAVVDVPVPSDLCDCPVFTYLNQRVLAESTIS